MRCGRSRRAARQLGSGTDPQLKRTSREFRLPADLLAVLEKMRRKRIPTPATLREQSIAHPSLAVAARLSVRNSRLTQREKPSFVIRFEATGETRDGRLATLTRLSLRERELALMVTEGKSNQEIADALGVS